MFKSTKYKVTKTKFSKNEEKLSVLFSKITFLEFRNSTHFVVKFSEIKKPSFVQINI